MKALLFIFMVVALAACATAQRLNGLSIGMSKAKVIEVMGDPDYSGTREGKQVMGYELRSGVYGFFSRYVVVLENGKLTQYGHADVIFPPSEAELADRRKRASMAMLFMQQQHESQMQMQNQQAHALDGYQQSLQGHQKVHTTCHNSGYGQIACDSESRDSGASIYQNLGAPSIGP